MIFYQKPSYSDTQPKGKKIKKKKKKEKGRKLRAGCIHPGSGPIIP